ncbi:MAG: hypothetical protein A2Z16_13105 [Chloroflexi bacterium RBG_16_54_18]|nr:MAG: hypothetical protein A2Z16_13105 [Chloroflexi bacterium RBG_16_54_18]
MSSPTFMIATRNEQVEELVIYSYVIGFPCSFINALIFHFVNLYTGRPVKWAIVAVWIGTGVFVLLSLAGLFIFVYSFTEHILFTFVGEKIGEESNTLHLISVAVGIAVLMPF